jgi:ketosteroid isomerase-like protein
MGRRVEKEVRRTFQVVFYGAVGAGKATSLRALRAHLPGSGPLVEIPMPWQLGGRTIFFDAQLPVDRGLRATLRLRAVATNDVKSQAFLALVHCDALVFVFDAETTRAADNLAAWEAALQHFATYRVDPRLLPIVVQVTKLDRPHTAPVSTAVDHAPRVNTNPAIGTGMAELAQVIVSTVSDAFHEGRAPGRKTKEPSRKYLEKARALAAAADIATDVGGDASPLALSTKGMALHPELGFESLASLASLETAFFTYWHEGTGEQVDAFWREIERQGLPYRRRDVAAEVLAKGRITNRGDYETVTDLISDERFSPAEQARLGAMLGAYEASAGRRRSR